MIIYQDKNIALREILHIIFRNFISKRNSHKLWLISNRIRISIEFLSLMRNIFLKIYSNIYIFFLILEAFIFSFLLLPIMRRKNFSNSR